MTQNSDADRWTRQPARDLVHRRLENGTREYPVSTPGSTPGSTRWYAYLEYGRSTPGVLQDYSGSTQGDVRRRMRRCHRYGHAMAWAQRGGGWARMIQIPRVPPWNTPWSTERLWSTPEYPAEYPHSTPQRLRCRPSTAEYPAEYPPEYAAAAYGPERAAPVRERD